MISKSTILGLQCLITKPLNPVSANEQDNLITTHRKPKNGFSNFGYIKTRGLGIIMWRLVLRSSSTRSGKHVPSLHLDVSDGYSIRHPFGK